MKNRFPRFLAGFFIWIVYRLLLASWRITIEESPSFQELRKRGKPCIICHWHGDELPLLWLVGFYDIATISSQSLDGEMMNLVLRLLGGKTVRGSSSRGGVQALKGMIRLVGKENHIASFAVDGPRGPLYEVKPGAFEVSRLTGSPIFYFGVSCNRAWHFPKSWNRAYLPKPFSLVYISVDGPFESIPNYYQNTKDPNVGLQLAQVLHAAKRRAEEKILVGTRTRC